MQFISQCQKYQSDFANLSFLFLPPFCMWCYTFPTVTLLPTSSNPQLHLLKYLRIHLPVYVYIVLLLILLPIIFLEFLIFILLNFISTEYILCCDNSVYYFSDSMLYQVKMYTATLKKLLPRNREVETISNL